MTVVLALSEETVQTGAAPIKVLIVVEKSSAEGAELSFIGGTETENRYGLSSEDVVQS